MTLVNLRKSVERYRELVSSIAPNVNAQQLEQLRGLPFYSLWNCGDKVTDFNHLVGLPQKNGQAYPLFEYERELFNTLISNKHLWVKKATGLGITEFVLRYMAWLCVKGRLIKRGPNVYCYWP